MANEHFNFPRESPNLRKREASESDATEHRIEADDFLTSVLCLS